MYRARDTRLGCDVAVKILPAALASDPQFRERFEREARSISQLTHPHICTLCDVGEEPAAHLVMELLEGETPAARLQKDALPLADALRIAVEIADALDKAHRQGIVYRDLKPGNIMLTKGGSKLLDFGLAKIGVQSSVSAAAPTALAASAVHAESGAHGRSVSARASGTSAVYLRELGAASLTKVVGSEDSVGGKSRHLGR